MEKINDNRHVDNHPGTMNFRTRLHEAQRIHHRNMILAERLHTIKPHYKVEDLTLMKPIRVKSPRGGTGGDAYGTYGDKSNKKKTKFVKELELTFLQQGGNKANRSNNQSPHSGRGGYGHGDEDGVNEGNLFVVDYTSNGNTPFASPRMPGAAEARPRSILLEYTKVQDNRVLDIAVLKEPYRDSYVIFGKDIEDGQRYELRLSSEDVSNILDGDILVTSVDNVEVWMALLQKVKLNKCDFFTKLPFTRQEVDFVTRGNPLSASADTDGLADERDMGRNGELDDDMLVSGRMRDDDPGMLMTGDGLGSSEGEGEFGYVDASFDAVEDSPTASERDRGISVPLEAVPQQERVFTPTAPTRPGRTTEGPRKGSHRQLVKSGTGSNSVAEKEPLSDPIQTEVEVDVTVVLVEPLQSLALEPEDKKEGQLEQSIAASSIEPPLSEPGPSIVISEDEQRKLQQALLAAEEEKRRKEREKEQEREEIIQAIIAANNPVGSRPKTNPKSRESLSRPTGGSRPSTITAAPTPAPVQVVAVKEKEKEKEPVAKKTTGRASILNKQPVPAAASTQAAPSSSNNTTTNPVVTPRKPSVAPTGNGPSSNRKSMFKGASPSPSPANSAPSADPTVAGSGKAAAKVAAPAAAAPAASSSGIAGNGKDSILTNSVKAAISNIIQYDIQQAEKKINGNKNNETIKKDDDKEKQKEIVLKEKEKPVEDKTTKEPEQKKPVEVKVTMEQEKNKAAIPSPEVALARMASLKEVAMTVVDQALTNVLQKFQSASKPVSKQPSLAEGSIISTTVPAPPSAVATNGSIISTGSVKSSKQPAQQPSLVQKEASLAAPSSVAYSEKFEQSEAEGSSQAYGSESFENI